MSTWKSATIIFFLNMAATAHAQISPFKAQSRHLMGEAKETVSENTVYHVGTTEACLLRS